MNGKIRVKIEDDNQISYKEYTNNILRPGKLWMLNTLLGEKSDLAIESILFGDGGKGKKVDFNQKGLYGITRVNKPVVLHKDEENMQLIASITLEKKDGNGFVLNEMGLKMSNGELFAFAIIDDINKHEKLKLSWDWLILI